MVDTDSVGELEVGLRYFGKEYKAKFTTEIIQKPSAELILRSKIRFTDERIFKII
jgi:hypothetical protein